MQINFNDFSGGIAPTFDAQKPLQNSYPMLVNGRIRKNAVAPVKRSIEDEAPAGKKQGIYSLDYYLILFVAGRIFYKDRRSPYNGYVMVEDISLSETADVIHMLAVPSSTLNFKRASIYATAAVEYSSVPVATSQAGALCMDGVNQDVILYPTATGLAARRTQTYDQWQLTQYSGSNTTYGDAQEYVPVGLYPIWTGQKVFKLGKDNNGRYTRILQSVSGRPLDFCVVVDQQGNKKGNADAVAHSAAYEEAVSLFVVPSQDTSFVACTATRTFGIFGDPSILIFGEYFLRTIPLFDAGSTGHYSSVDVNGALTFIGRNAIHAINAVAQDKQQSLSKYVSNNRTFSTPIAQLLSNTTYGCAVRFDDYALYAMNTVIGPAVVVYDINAERFVALDKWAGVGEIVKFAVTYWNGVEELWCYTRDNKVHHIFGSDEYETARLYIGDLCSQDAAVTHVIKNISAMFSNVIANTEVSINVYKDRLLVDSTARTLTGEKPYLESIIPFDEAKVRTFDGFQLATSDTRAAFTSGIMIAWNSAAKLSNFSVALDRVEQVTPNTNAIPAITKVAFVGSSLLTGSYNDEQAFPQVITNINKAGVDYTFGAGDHTEDGSLPAYNAVKHLYKRLGKFSAASGDYDLAVDLGQVFYNYLGNGQRNYRVDVSPLLSVFVICSGYSIAGSLPVNQPPDTAPDGNDENSIQAKWLKAQLAVCPAKCRIVLMHHDPFTEDALYAPGYNLLRWPFRSWGATMVISGHSRSYQRKLVDNLPYAVVGTGGATLMPLNNDTETTVFATDQDFGHAELTVMPHSAIWKFVAIDGRVLDKLTIQI